MKNAASETVIGPGEIATFVDDASGFLDGEPEYATPASIPAPFTPLYFDKEASYKFSPPSPEAAAAAKKFWLPIIRRYTQTVPDKKGRLRPRPSMETNHGLIVVDVGRFVAASHLVQGGSRSAFAGCEVDVTGKIILTLFATEDLAPDSRDPAGAKRVRERIIPIPWTDIVNVRFEIDRLVQPATRTGTDG